MIGEIKFEVIDPANHYRLSDGTSLHFLTADNTDGITNEELIGVLVHRLRVQGRNKPTKATSRAITKLEEVEEVLWRFSVEKNQQKEAACVV